METSSKTDFKQFIDAYYGTHTADVIFIMVDSTETNMRDYKSKQDILKQYSNIKEIHVCEM